MPPLTNVSFSCVESDPKHQMLLFQFQLNYASKPVLCSQKLRQTLEVTSQHAYTNDVTCHTYINFNINCIGLGLVHKSALNKAGFLALLAYNFVKMCR